MILTDSISCDLDFDTDGKRIGNLNLSFSDNRHAFDTIPIPIAVIKNGIGPTILLTAGNHGDEYEGQVILRRMIHEINPRDVTGRIIILPAMNYPAVLSNSRVSPLDNGNLNRSFPGVESGQPTSAIAHFVSNQLLPMCDAGIDLHSGGTACDILPSAFLCGCKDKDVLQRSLGLCDAFGAPYTFVVRGADAATGYDPAAQSQGIAFMSTVLGGGGRIDIDALEIGITGVSNVLAYLGIVGDPESEQPQTRYLNGVDGFSSVNAPFSGIFQPFHKLGDNVDANQVAGILFSIEEVDRVPLELSFKNSGVVLATRNGARVRRGGHVYLVVEEVARGKALELLQS